MVSKSTHKALGLPACQPMSNQLRAYGSRPLAVEGQCFVDVQVGKACRRNLRLIVVNEPRGDNLFGMDWSDAFGLSQQGTSLLDSLVEEGTQHTAAQVQQSSRSPSDSANVRKVKVTQLEKRFPHVFSPKLGHCEKVKIKLHLKPDAKPVFSLPRRIPFAIKQACKEELDRLVELRVLERIHYSDWAAPIVMVSKPSGALRICGDFKLLNQQLQGVGQSESVDLTILHHHKFFGLHLASTP